MATALEFTYLRERCWTAVAVLTIRRESYWWEPRPLPELTEKELASVPESFRCYACNSICRKRVFGGYLLRQRVCRNCWPWVDEATIRGLIHWDEKHGYSNYVRE